MVEGVFAGLEDPSAIGQARHPKIPAGADHAGLRQQCCNAAGGGAARQVDVGGPGKTLVGTGGAIEQCAAGHDSGHQQRARGPEELHSESG